MKIKIIFCFLLMVTSMPLPSQVETCKDIPVHGECPRSLDTNSSRYGASATLLGKSGCIEPYENYYKSHKIHLDARRLRSKGYSALYWFILSSIVYYKTHQNYPWLSVIFALLALDNGVNMLHYYHEAQCAVLEEERAFDIVRDIILALRSTKQVPEHQCQ